MKRLKYFLIALLALCLIIPPAWAGTAKQMKYGIRFVDEGADHSTPPSGYLELYVNSDALYVIDDSGNKTDVVATTIIYHDTVELTNAQVKDLHDTPVSLVATPGANKFLEFVSAVLILDYGSNALTESTDNLVIEYITSGADVTGTIEMTGFIEQTVDQMALVLAAGIATDAASDIVNNGLQLFNPDDDFGGNGGGDTTMTVKIAYRIHADGLE